VSLICAIHRTGHVSAAATRERLELKRGAWRHVGGGGARADRSEEHSTVPPDFGEGSGGALRKAERATNAGEPHRSWVAIRCLPPSLRSVHRGSSGRPRLRGCDLVATERPGWENDGVRRLPESAVKIGDARRNPKQLCPMCLSNLQLADSPFRLPEQISQCAPTTYEDFSSPRRRRRFNAGHLAARCSPRVKARPP
jgi:hypothetical protein